MKLESVKFKHDKYGLTIELLETKGGIFSSSNSYELKLPNIEEKNNLISVLL